MQRPDTWTVGKQAKAPRPASSIYASQLSGNHQPSPYLRRYRLPSLNASPSDSYEDLLSPLTDYYPTEMLMKEAAASPSNLVQHGRAGSWWEAESKSDTDLRRLSPYERTLRELQQLKERRSRLGSTSDYFSISGGSFSEAGSSSGGSSAGASPCPPPEEPGTGERSLLALIASEREALDRRSRQLLDLPPTLPLPPPPTPPLRPSPDK